MSRTALMITGLLLAGCTAPATDGAASPGGRPATAALKDALLLNAVKATLVTDDPDSSATVGVAVRDAVVTLRGSVKDAATRERLVADARKTAGVKRVVDELRIGPRRPKR